MRKGWEAVSVLFIILIVVFGFIRVESAGAEQINPTGEVRLAAADPVDDAEFGRSLAHLPQLKISWYMISDSYE